MTAQTGYAIASGLRGFSSTTLRVLVTEARDGYVWIITADLQDAGTRLVLDDSQVVMEEDAPSYATASSHRDGLVTFG